MDISQIKKEVIEQVAELYFAAHMAGYVCKADGHLGNMRFFIKDGSVRVKRAGDFGVYKRQNESEDLADKVTNEIVMIVLHLSIYKPFKRQYLNKIEELYKIFYEVYKRGFQAKFATGADLDGLGEEMRKTLQWFRENFNIEKNGDNGDYNGIIQERGYRENDELSGTELIAVSVRGLSSYGTEIHDAI